MLLFVFYLNSYCSLRIGYSQAEDPAGIKRKIGPELLRYADYSTLFSGKKNVLLFLISDVTAHTLYANYLIF